MGIENPFAELGKIIAEGFNLLMPDAKLRRRINQVNAEVLASLKKQRPEFHWIEARLGERYMTCSKDSWHFYAAIEGMAPSEKGNALEVAVMVYCYSVEGSRTPSYDAQEWVAVGAYAVAYKLPAVKRRDKDSATERRPEANARPQSIRADATNNMVTGLGRKPTPGERREATGRNREKGIDVWRIGGFNEHLMNPKTPRRKIGRGTGFNEKFDHPKKGGLPREKWKPAKPAPGPASRVARAAGRAAVRQLFGDNKKR